MKKNMGRFGLVILALTVLLVQGCAELDELRIANRRQAITVRDQMSELDKLKAELDAAKKVNVVYKGRVQSDEKVKKMLRAELERLASSIGEGAVVRDTAEGPMIQLPETILFDSGLAKLKPKGEIALEKIAKHLTSNPAAIVRIDGHTDNDPIVKSKYLWESNHHLSAGRALSVLHYLVNKGHIEESRVHIAGYGPNRPIASNKNKAGKMQNRRVEFLILSPESR
ncbi:MAG: flagellar motor protein MotB [Candidatus Scalindua rubra]|uniref:Flagellar motor protein MotB n=1 Tax=Candidatus Scalindua brodae TaxID=237368 RepID=A0A0B0ERV2_9BACT|nr:MAG: flagellar motor protein MotB [Candidatus Scalindua brodae]MBZ0108100.1 flagellar motor protein MotB [Candidatus Scalindua rubra]TWU31282.1 putative lipoprotein YiaD precursor [Candidatus Brocadiaceae bacterium S225]